MKWVRNWLEAEELGRKVNQTWYCNWNTSELWLFHHRLRTKGNQLGQIINKEKGVVILILCKQLLSEHRWIELHYFSQLPNRHKRMFKRKRKVSPRLNTCPEHARDSVSGTSLTSAWSPDLWNLKLGTEVWGLDLPPPGEQREKKEMLKMKASLSSQ